MQNDNLKLKINKIQTPVIASADASARSNPHRSIASLFIPPFCGHHPETSGRCPKYY